MCACAWYIYYCQARYICSLLTLRMRRPQQSATGSKNHFTGQFHIVWTLRGLFSVCVRCVCVLNVGVGRALGYVCLSHSVCRSIYSELSNNLIHFEEWLNIVHKFSGTSLAAAWWSRRFEHEYNVSLPLYPLRRAAFYLARILRLAQTSYNV